jgi:hypothetical protein
LISCGKRWKMPKRFCGADLGPCGRKIRGDSQSQVGSSCRGVEGDGFVVREFASPRAAAESLVAQALRLLKS